MKERYTPEAEADYSVFCIGNDVEWLEQHFEAAANTVNPNELRALCARLETLAERIDGRLILFSQLRGSLALEQRGAA